MLYFADTAESMDEDDGMLAGDQNLADVYFQLNQLAKYVLFPI